MQLQLLYFLSLWIQHCAISKIKIRKAAGKHLPCSFRLQRSKEDTKAFLLPIVSLKLRHLCLPHQKVLYLLQVRHHFILPCSDRNIWSFNSVLCIAFSNQQSSFKTFLFFSEGNWMGIQSCQGLKAIGFQCWAWCNKLYLKHYSQNICEQPSYGS